MNEENPIANPTVVLREEFDNWAFLFDPDTAKTVIINPVGAEVWRLMDGKRDLKAILAEINSRFSAVPNNASEQVADFIKALKEFGFVGYGIEVKQK